MDHLESEEIEIVPVYLDSKRKPYKISKSQLYSNTPSDFDFKLRQTATPLSEKTLVKLLKSVDIVFPVMHGPFGED
jgi:D-alanine-D-alanine ligase-like ATP-grasp enzyme